MRVIPLITIEPICFISFLTTSCYRCYCSSPLTQLTPPFSVFLSLLCCSIVWPNFVCYRYIIIVYGHTAVTWFLKSKKNMTYFRMFVCFFIFSSFFLSKCSHKLRFSKNFLMTFSPMVINRIFLFYVHSTLAFYIYLRLSVKQNQQLDIWYEFLFHRRKGRCYCKE